MSWFTRLRNTLARTDRDIEAEQRFHIEARIEEYRSAAWRTMRRAAPR